MAAEECLQVTVIDTLIEEDTLGGLVFLAFLLSLLIGFIIGALIMRYIFREIEDHNMRRKKKQFSVPVIEEDSRENKNSPSLMKKMGSNRIFPVDESDGKTVAIEMGHTNTKDIGLSQRSLDSPDGQVDAGSHSFADALIKKTGEEVEVELQTQDFGYIQKMEQNLRNEKCETFLQLLKMILTFLLSKSRIDETFKRTTLAKYEQVIVDIVSNSKKAEEEKELRETLAYSGDLENALEGLHSKYSKKMDLQLIEQQEQFGRDLMKESSALTEEEAEQILSKLMTNFAGAEKRRAEEINRQTMVLHERLAKRQMIAQQRAADKQEEIEEFQERRKQSNNIIILLKKRGKLMDDQCDRILDKYQEDLKNLEEKHQQAALKHEADLAARLRRKRERKTKMLLNELEGEKEEFEARANQMIAESNMTAEDYLEAFHQLKVQQQAKIEEEEESNDKLEAEELQDLAQQLSDRLKRSVNKRENELFLEIKQQAHLSSKEAERMMKKHEEQLEEYTGSRMREKERQQALIKEKLNERRKRWKREAEERALEQDQMATEQENTLKQVLNTQIGLNEQLRKQVMLEHEQNIIALKNHLQISRIRQQKKVEHRLAQRRARLAELKKNMEQEISRQAQGDPEKMKIITRSQNIEYQAEVKKMEEDHQAALEDLRRRLAAETEEALRDQDDRLGKILGKLQVEVARRDEIIKNRDVAIRNLEKKLVDTLTREGTMADAQTDRILKQHQKQVDRLNQNIETEREKQMMKIREKIEMKLLKKERMMEAKRNQEMDEIKAKGVRTASSTLSLILSDQKHKKEMEELQNEMRLELRRQTELLNKEMQQQFVKDLQEEEEAFLAKVAEVSNIPEEELMMAIKTSASEAGMDSKLTKQIAKDVRKRVRSIRKADQD